MNDSPQPDGRLLQHLERSDAEAAADVALGAPPDMAQALGLAVARFGPAVATFASRVDVLAFNRVIGLGGEEEATEPMLDEIVARYREAGVPRFFIQVSPHARPEGLVDWLGARGLVHHNSWMKLYRPADPAPRTPTRFRIDEIDGTHAAAFGRLVANAFDMPEPVGPWLAASVGRPGWKHYAAFDGDEPVATAALFLFEDVGWFGFASTREEYRGGGAQSALIARRIDDARAAGCRWLVVETARETAERRAPSFHNVKRLGFQLAYERKNYIWRAG